MTNAVVREILPAKEIVQEMVAEAARALERASGLRRRANG